MNQRSARCGWTGSLSITAVAGQLVKSCALIQGREPSQKQEFQILICWHIARDPGPGQQLERHSRASACKGNNLDIDMGKLTDTEMLNRSAGIGCRRRCGGFRTMPKRVCGLGTQLVAASVCTGCCRRYRSGRRIPPHCPLWVWQCLVRWRPGDAAAGGHPGTRGGQRAESRASSRW